MKKLLFWLILFQLFINIVNAETSIGQYVLYIDSFTVIQLKKAKNIIKEKVKNYPQPASLLKEFEINKNEGYVYVEVDSRVEKLQAIKKCLNQGKIKKVGFYNFNCKGYNRDKNKAGNIYQAKETRDKYVPIKYEIGTSTP